MALAKRDIWFAESRFGFTASLDSDSVEFPFYPQIQSQICKTERLLRNPDSPWTHIQQNEYAQKWLTASHGACLDCMSATAATWSLQTSTVSCVKVSLNCAIRHTNVVHWWHQTPPAMHSVIIRHMRATKEFISILVTTIQSCVNCTVVKLMYMNVSFTKKTEAADYKITAWLPHSE